MARNPESELTDFIRRELERRGALFIKLSDRFTRGVPDAYVCTNRGVMIEFKIGDLGDAVVTYKQLGMSGAQDHHIRGMHRRHRKSACVVTGARDGTALRLWVPVTPQREGPGFESYRIAAKGEAVFKWLE